MTRTLEFLSDESGVETMEFIAMLVLVAALVAIITTAYGSMGRKAESAKEAMGRALDGVEGVEE